MNNILKSIASHQTTQVVAACLGAYSVFSFTDFAKAYPDFRIFLLFFIVILRCAYIRSQNYSHLSTGIICFTLGLSATQGKDSLFLCLIVCTFGLWVLLSFDGKTSSGEAELKPL